MDLKLSWDLFILVFFAIVVAYSFIIGRTDTLKIIIATYIGTLSADGLGNLFSSLLKSSPNLPKLINFFGYIGGVEQITSIFKILLFVAVIVILTIWGDYHVHEAPRGNAVTNLIILISISVLSCGLILSTILVFANGGSLISGDATTVSGAFTQIYQQSHLVRYLLDWHDAWFSLPAVLFVFISISQRNQPE